MASARSIRRAQAALLCEICEKGNTIEWKCITCGEMMCPSCKDIHLRTRALRNHKVVKFEDIKGHEGAKIVDDPVYCDEHPDEQVHMYCERCEVLVCQECIVGKHNGHTFAKLSQIRNRQEKELEMFIEKSQQKLASYQKAKKSMQTNKSESSHETARNAAELKEKYAQLKAILDEAMEELNLKIQQRGKINQKELDKRIARVDKTISPLQEFIQRCQDKMTTSTTDMTQFLTKAKKEFRQFKEYVEPEVVRSPVYITGESNPKLIASFLGYLDEDEEYAKTSDFEEAEPVPKIKVKILSSFTTDMKYNRICTVGDTKIWLGKFQSNRLELVDFNGRVLEQVSTDFPVCDIALSLSGNLLVTVYRGYRVKRMTKGNSFVDLCDTTPFCTYDLHVTECGDILVGLFDIHGSKEGRIVRMSPEGHVLQTVRHKQHTNTLPFDDLCPLTLTETRNQNLFVILMDGSDKRSLVCLDWNGNIKTKYTGASGGDKDEFNPVYIATDRYNNVIVGDFNNCSAHLINENGQFIQYLLTQKDGLDSHTGLHIDKSGCLWVSDYESKKIHRIKYIA